MHVVMLTADIILNSKVLTYRPKSKHILFNQSSRSVSPNYIMHCNNRTFSIPTYFYIYETNRDAKKLITNDNAKKYDQNSFCIRPGDFRTGACFYMRQTFYF